MLTHNLTHFINLFTGYTKELSIPEPISNPVIPAPDKDYGLIMEFKDYTMAELSYTLNKYLTIDSLTLSFSISKDDTEETKEFLTQVLTDYHLIIPVLRDYLFSIFSETTNSDACSHIIEFDTDHGTMPGEEGTWNLIVRITDYLS